MRAGRALAPAAGAVVLQWIVLAATIGLSARGLVLAGLAAALVALAGEAIGGRAMGAVAALVWVVGPPALTRFWYLDPTHRFRTDWHDRVLPVLAGAHESSRLLAGVALLAALLALLRLRPRLGVPAAALLVVGAAAAVRLDQATWAFAWHGFAANLSAVREQGWSVRLVEFIPVAGLIGILLRRPARGIVLLVGLLAAFAVPWGRDRGSLLATLLIVVPGLPLYALACSGVTKLVPQPWRVRLGAALQDRARRAAPARP